MESPPPNFINALKKYLDEERDLEGAKLLLEKETDVLSKSLLVLIDVNLEKADDTEIQERISAMNLEGNDIALLFCYLAQEQSLQMIKANNLLRKRFGIEYENNEVIPEASEAPEAPV